MEDSLAFIFVYIMMVSFHHSSSLYLVLGYTTIPSSLKATVRETPEK